MTKSKAGNSTTVKAGTKNEGVIALMTREGGASLAEITEATGWLPHSARAALTGFRKKGLVIDRAKVNGVTCYQVSDEPSA